MKNGRFRIQIVVKIKYCNVISKINKCLKKGYDQSAREDGVRGS